MSEEKDEYVDGSDNEEGKHEEYVGVNLDQSTMVVNVI